jgi:hypothetical protein
MTTAVLTAAPLAVTEIDNRVAYAGFGFAYVFGHGAAALSIGPSWLPMTLLGTGLAIGTIAATVAATRVQRGASAADVRTGKLLGTAWVTGFAALFLAITGLTTTLNMPELQSVLWPTGSALVVGLLYLGEGAARRNTLHYALGSWLALVATASLFFAAPGPFWILAVAGGGAYAVATVLETRRLG